MLIQLVIIEIYTKKYTMKHLRQMWMAWNIKNLIYSNLDSSYKFDFNFFFNKFKTKIFRRTIISEIFKTTIPDEISY